jgi:oligoendopeptidase F
MCATHESAVIINRSEVELQHTWDISKLFLNDTDWEAGLKKYTALAEQIPGFKGTLGTSADGLADYLDFSQEFGILEERLHYYSDLRQTEDEGNSAGRTMTGRFMMAHARAQAASAWGVPEIQAIPDTVMEGFLKESRLAEYRIYLKKLLRYKPYILSHREERLLALHAEGEGLGGEAFSVLTNVDMDF